MGHSVVTLTPPAFLRIRIPLQFLSQENHNLFLFIVELQKTNVTQSQPPYKSFLCTEQETGEMLFLLFYLGKQKMGEWTSTFTIGFTLTSFSPLLYNLRFPQSTFFVVKTGLEPVRCVEVLLSTLQKSMCTNSLSFTLTTT